MHHPEQISIQNYTYILPNDKIALHPLEERDASKLLIYKNEAIVEDVYKNIHEHIPNDSLLIFNNTKVINARIIFTKQSGGIIEIFLLEPNNADYSTSLTTAKTCQWKCLIGGASKWKEAELKLIINNCELRIIKKHKIDDSFLIEFSWDGNISFAEILDQVGNVPLPPYIKRKVETEDVNRYQTIFAQQQGSVAAPTAGLHFTDNIFTNFEKKNTNKAFVTLHVGAGTFKPVKAAVMAGHQMHTEWIDVTVETIENMLSSLNKKIIAVGTTSLRTLESLYWLGVKAMLHPKNKNLQLTQWEVYEEPLCQQKISATNALQALLAWLKENNKPNLFTSTQILIAPGYKFKIADAIVTNFHQPQSTLLLLVAAAVGKKWKDIYNYALQNNFRFLSYGDGSLLWIEK